jgi:hypothetical protein
MQARHVWYNGGSGKEKQYALVANEHSEEMLDLIILTSSGNDFETSVPRRAPSDYGPEGGGRTWHE